jgi:phosphatidylglycerophosphate synthase
MDRREIATRKTQWAQLFGRAIARTGITPNQISVLGIGFALASGAFFYLAGHDKSKLYLFWAAACIQLRLLCNMLDGLVAVENNKKSVYGDLYNEIPDRIEDILIFVGAGYFIPESSWLGWLMALLAVLTAYLRCLGNALGCKAYFLGPQAKQHRMFVLTVGAIAQMIFGFELPILRDTLIFIGVGTVITFIRRLAHIAKELKERPSV